MHNNPSRSQTYDVQEKKHQQLALNEKYLNPFECNQMLSTLHAACTSHAIHICIRIEIVHGVLNHKTNKLHPAYRLLFEMR